jgi:hypothetical protein
MGAWRGAKQAGGGSHQEARHGVAAEVHRIVYRRKEPGTEDF